jgi:hypothetical protein
MGVIGYDNPQHADKRQLPDAQKEKEREGDKKAWNEARLNHQWNLKAGVTSVSG